MTRKIINKILLWKYTKRAIYWVLGILVGMVYVLYVKGGMAFNSDIAKIVVTPTVVFLSLVLTAKQFAYNREWNKKDAAHKSNADFSKSYNEIIEYLHSVIDIRYHIANKERISVSDIHNLMGVFSKQGDNTYRFIHHGGSDEEIVPQNIEEAYTKTKKSKIDGRKVERSIVRLLGEFEYICSGIDNEILDKKTVMDLLGPTIVNGYYVFEYYILHKRYCNRHGGNRYTLFEKFEKIAKENAEKEVESEEIEEQHYKVPFLSGD